jgi:Bacterial membrane protein YfhO
MLRYGAHWKKQLIHSGAVLTLFALLYTIVFFPRICDGSSNISGDVFAYYLPVFLAPRSLWTNLLHSGFPSFADPQFQLWYPLNRLFSLFPHTWEAFTISAYVLASSFTYGYVYCLTRSRLAAVTSGLIYGMSGFMMAYWGYSTILHAAAWIPLLIWALDELRDGLSRRWLIAGIMAVACILLAGHPQVAVYGLALATAYAIVCGYTATISRWLYYRTCGLITLLAFGFAAIQLLPTLEFAQLSVRAHMTFGEFVSNPLPLQQITQIVFPYYVPSKANWLMGIFNYVGLLAPFLAIIGVLTSLHRRQRCFWLVVALLGFVFALGDQTSIAQIMYHLPIYNKFRAPIRTLLVTTLGMSVLAGFGIASLQQKLVSSRLFRQGALASFAMITMNFVVVLWQQIPPNPWLMLVFPIGQWSIGLGLLIWYQRSRSHLRRQRILLFVVLSIIVDLTTFSWLDLRYPGGFGWLGYHTMSANHRQYLIPSTMVKRYQQQLIASSQRLLPIRGVMGTYEGVGSGTLDDIPPNTSLLWGVPSASGYGPLILSRYQQLNQIDNFGAVPLSVVDSADRGLDLMSVKYLLVSEPKAPMTASSDPSKVVNSAGLRWHDVELGRVLGAGVCRPESADTTTQVSFSDQGQPTTEIGLVTMLGCSVTIPDNAAVAQIQVTDVQGQVETHPFLAGRDTAETAYDCPDVRSKMQHQRAKIYRDLASPTCPVHQYVTVLKLKRPQAVRQLQIKWANQLGVLQVSRISLFDRRTAESYPVKPIELNSRWQPVEPTPSGMVYENKKVMPRTWLVPETLHLTSAQVLTAIRTSRLPDGQTYEPQKMALVETPQALLKAVPLQSTDRAEILKLEDTYIQIQTQVATPKFLVLSDVFYPGWQATIDGKATKIFQANYVQRGVQVPTGEHVIEFKFEPMSFRLGASITVLSLFCAGYWLFLTHRCTSPVKLLK